MTDDPRLFEVFLDVQRGLPRQGPGSDVTTRAALDLCVGLPPSPSVLDVGCGPGMQTLALARALDGRITAVDLFDEYLGQLQARAEAEGFAGRIEAVQGDMSALPFPPASFDLVWSEGAAYIMGFGNALAAWRPLLKPGGCVAVSEIVWLTPSPPAEVAAFFAEECPAMTDVATNLATLRDAGYTTLGHLALPDSAWWENYYAPLEAKLPAMAEKYAGDADALAVVEASRREIDLRRRFADAYGYAFFVGRKAD